MYNWYLVFVLQSNRELRTSFARKDFEGASKPSVFSVGFPTALPHFHHNESSRTESFSEAVANLNSLPPSKTLAFYLDRPPNPL